jgi:hypothetical protein
VNISWQKCQSAQKSVNALYVPIGLVRVNLLLIYVPIELVWI